MHCLGLVAGNHLPVAPANLSCILVLDEKEISAHQSASTSVTKGAIMVYMQSHRQKLGDCLRLRVAD
jgi:hypothetical protein